MAEQSMTEDSVRAMAALVGLKLTDKRVAELLPQLQKSAALAKENRSLDLTGVEPDFKFDPERL
ncbi:MAG: DUF4089 domain-containing protein [Chloroflexi bacterium]|nr:DUF4089 domain-containing protein [Chloroflexota bacterium]